MISLETKLLDEVDKPEDSKILSENNERGIVERESSWTGQITGVSPFRSGTANGRGNSKIFKNGISISNWYGIFTLLRDKKYLSLEKM